MWFPAPFYLFFWIGKGWDVWGFLKFILMVHV